MKCSGLDNMSSTANCKALVAMSGGVDSSVAALLTCKVGYDSIGVMLKLHDDFELESNVSCGTSSDTKDAENIAYSIGIDFRIYDCSAMFEKEVIDRFVYAYRHGYTPNPCIECNRYMKFGALFEKADELGAEYIVTGHYARTEYDEKYGRIVLKKAVDETKDQSYVLYSLSKEQLSRVLFPLGSYTKSEIREIAERSGLSVANKKDSQDICFIADGDYVRFIEKRTNTMFECGNFIDKSGNILGKHKGIIRYTIGQHKKLGIVTPEPMYVERIIPETNEIVLVNDAELYKTTVKVANVLWSAFDTPPTQFKAEAKLRYRHKAAPCTVYTNDNGCITLEFDTPQRAPAKGQAAVIYDGDILLGGGTIF